ncbi:hypothetical protein Droror1_Dr00009834 [Drosera rotundifolia]
MAEHLSTEEAAGIKEKFEMVDTGKQGKISKEELRAGLLKLTHQGDVDRDGYLDYKEFIAVSIHLRKLGNDEHIHKAFVFFDKNGSGYIVIEKRN